MSGRDSELSRACLLAQEGNPHDLLSIYQREIAPKLTHLFRSKVPADMTVEDLINEVALRVARVHNQSVLRDTNDFMAYCCTIAKNVLRDTFRRFNRDQPYLGPSFDDESPFDVSDQPHDYDNSLKLHEIAGVIRGISPRQRDVLELTAKGIEGREASQVFGMKYGSYRELLFRARRSLRRKLSDPDRNS